VTRHMRRQFRREAREEMDKRAELDKRDDGGLDGQDAEVAVQRGPDIAVAVDDIDAPPIGTGRLGLRGPMLCLPFPRGGNGNGKPMATGFYRITTYFGAQRDLALFRCTRRLRERPGVLGGADVLVA
jgi:hypothetical protein